MPDNTNIIEVLDTDGQVVSTAAADRPIPQDHLRKEPGPETVTIAGHTYRLPRLGRLNRKAVKRIQPLMVKAAGADADLDALWELAAALMPDVPTDDIDDLGIDDLKTILDGGGLIAFTGDDAPETRNLTITLGES